jgi:hypothetical protein
MRRNINCSGTVIEYTFLLYSAFICIVENCVLRIINIIDPWRDDPEVSDDPDTSDEPDASDDTDEDEEEEEVSSLYFDRCPYKLNVSIDHSACFSKQNAILRF